jgi:hypothetical protein
MKHTTLLLAMVALLLTGCNQQTGQLQGRGTEQPDTCINGVAYFSRYNVYMLYIDEATLQPVRCSTIQNKDLT